MTTFLRFPDEARAIACMGCWYDPENGWGAPRDGWAVDVLGTIYTEGEYDAEGNVIAAPAPLPGWHLNIMGEVPDKARPFVVEPTTPRRVFAA